MAVYLDMWGLLSCRHTTRVQFRRTWDRCLPLEDVQEKNASNIFCKTYLQPSLFRARASLEQVGQAGVHGVSDLRLGPPDDGGPLLERLPPVLNGAVGLGTFTVEDHVGVRAELAQGNGLSQAEGGGGAGAELKVRQCQGLAKARENKIISTSSTSSGFESGEMRPAKKVRTGAVEAG